VDAADVLWMMLWLLDEHQKSEGHLSVGASRALGELKVRITQGSPLEERSIIKSSCSCYRICTVKISTGGFKDQSL
jgi:hypothetical protein